MRGGIDPWTLTGTLILSLLAQGCGTGLSGEVRDAFSERPVTDAQVEVTTVGWGRRDGDLVWDKSFTHATKTDARGRFELDISGGANLRVTADGYRTVGTSLCSRSPSLIRIGGPFERVDLEKQLSIGTDPDQVVGWQFGAKAGAVVLAEAELAATRLPKVGSSVAQLRAPLGMAFVGGSGNPPTPPTSGYAPSLELDLLDCGWLFVRIRDGRMAAVKTGNFGLDEPINGGWFLMLSYGEIPAPQPRSK